MTNIENFCKGTFEKGDVIAEGQYSQNKRKESVRERGHIT